MNFKIKQYRIKKRDKINWICQEKVEVDMNHHLAKKKAVGEKKTKHKWELVGYYDTLKDAKKDLGERFARDVKDFKELEEVINLLNKIN